MNPVFGPVMDDALAQVAGRLSEEFPEFGEAIYAVHRNGGSEANVMLKLAPLLMARPEIAARLEVLMGEILLPATTTEASEWGGTSRSVIPSPSGTGRPRLNPVYEAAIGERIQFDGDVPELRTGPMPVGGTPAVPVSTEARNPVALGVMIGKASASVAEDMKAIEEAHVRHLEDSGTAIVREGRQAMLSAADRWNLPEPVGYERGRVPKAIEIATPRGDELLEMTPEQRQEAAWRFLSTTQGRRTAVSMIRKQMAVALQSDGYDVLPVDGEPEVVPQDRIVAHAQWVVTLTGQGSMQSSFSCVDVATRALVVKIEAALGDRRVPGARLEVIPVNAVDVRSFGWAARLVAP